MIKSFRHKGLHRFYLTGSKAGIQASHVGRMRMILARLDAAQTPKDMDLPGLRLHRLQGNYAGYYAVVVSGNWRVVFRFDGEHFLDVDYVDYH